MPDTLDASQTPAPNVASAPDADTAPVAEPPLTVPQPQASSAPPLDGFVPDEIDKLALHVTDLQIQLSTAGVRKAIDAMRAEVARHDNDMAALHGQEQAIIARIAAKRGISAAELTAGWVYNFETGQWSPRGVTDDGPK